MSWCKLCNKYGKAQEHRICEVSQQLTKIIELLEEKM